MKRKIRSIARAIVPKPILFGVWTAFNRWKARRACEIFQGAATEPQWLNRGELETLQDEYPFIGQSYAYDTASVDRRGRERAKMLVQMANSGQGRADSFLDLGSWDGMVCFYLQQMGKTAVGVDNRIEGYNRIAIEARTPLLGMDAACLGFEDNTFDFVFSFNSFEHFPEPDHVLREAIRVVRPGGQIYLSFGPIWLTPRGAHQFKAVTVPYCECLFPLELLEEFAHDKGLELIDFGQMNKWTVSQYRDLWLALADQVEVKSYYETFNAADVDLIERYPSCFRSKTTNFEDLIVSNIDVLFVKRRHKT